MTREEAINKVRQMSLPKETMDILEALAPELKESEDERIRKALCEFISDTLGDELDGYDISKNEALAYLEKQKEQKPEEWSEEDERILETIIYDFNEGYKSTIEQDRWLKSLKPQPHWKPSEEQTKLLQYLAKGIDVASHERHILDDMIDELKKLM